MATVVVGCDKNNSNDSNYQKTVVNALKKAGHTVETLTISSNAFADYSYKSKAKGKIGVYIIADGIFSIADLAFGNTYFKYGYFIIRGDLGRSKMDSWSDFNNNPIGADPDCTSICNKIKGKTYAEMNNMSSVKKKCQITFGKTAKEGADNLIKLMGGSSNSSSSSKSSSVSSIKSCIKELLYPWNGEVYCSIREDTVNIGRIPGPTMTILSVVEDENVHMDSVSLTDIDPNAINKLIVTAGNKQYIITDDARIKRFGEKKKSISTNLKSEKNIIDYAYKQWGKLLKNSGRVLECKVDGDYKWHVGVWVRVYIPSFELDGYMYLTKCSHDDKGVWTTNLNLVDYPPDLGEKPSKTDSGGS